MHLPDIVTVSELWDAVEHYIESFGHDIIAQQLRVIVHVQRIRLTGAEVPTLTGTAAEPAARIEKRSDLGDRMSLLVVLKQSRAVTPLGGGQPYEDPHGIATCMRIAVAPIGIAERVHAILSAAIAGIGNPHGLRVVGRGKREGAACRGNKRSKLGNAETFAGGGSLFFHPTTG